MQPQRPTKSHIKTMVLADKAKTAHHISHYLASADRQEIIQELGDVAYILLDYYMQQANYSHRQKRIG